MFSGTTQLSLKSEIAKALSESLKVKEKSLFWEERLSM